MVVTAIVKLIIIDMFNYRGGNLTTGVPQVYSLDNKTNNYYLAVETSISNISKFVINWFIATKCFFFTDITKSYDKSLSFSRSLLNMESVVLANNNVLWVYEYPLYAHYSQLTLHTNLTANLLPISGIFFVNNASMPQAGLDLIRISSFIDEVIEDFAQFYEDFSSLDLLEMISDVFVSDEKTDLILYKFIMRSRLAGINLIRRDGFSLQNHILCVGDITVDEFPYLLDGYTEYIDDNPFDLFDDKAHCIDFSFNPTLVEVGSIVRERPLFVKPKKNIITVDLDTLFGTFHLPVISTFTNSNLCGGFYYHSAGPIVGAIKHWTYGVIASCLFPNYSRKHMPTILRLINTYEDAITNALNKELSNSGHIYVINKSVKKSSVLSGCIVKNTLWGRLKKKKRSLSRSARRVVFSSRKGRIWV